MTTPTGDFNRKMFLSYVNHAIVGELIFDRRNPHQTEGLPALPIEEVKGYMIVDGPTLCLRSEHVYVEIDWKKLNEDLQEA